MFNYVIFIKCFTWSQYRLIHLDRKVLKMQIKIHQIRGILFTTLKLIIKFFKKITKYILFLTLLTSNMIV